MYNECAAIIDERGFFPERSITMQKNKTEQSRQFFVSKRTRGIQFALVTLDAMYEEAFYSREEDTIGEYAQNTTTWD